MADEDWTRSTFGDCASLVRESVDPVDMLGVPYIGLEHIGEQSLSLVGHGYSDDVSSTKTLFVEGDILFGKLRPYFRKVIIAPFDGMCSTDIWVVRPKANIDAKYLFYWMASRDFVDASMRGSEGTKMPRAQWEFVSRFERLVPPLETQQAIAYILGALDDKIELNRRMNETLEGIARAIFKSWFVDFDPVWAKAAGEQTPGLAPHIADLFPDEFVESELGEIPKGWEVELLADICEKPQYGYTASASDETVGPKFLRITDINKTPWIDWTAVPYCRIAQEQYPKYRLYPGDMLIARMADPGHGVVIEEEVAAVFASYLIRFRPVDESFNRYLQYWLRSPSYWDLVRARQAGTTRASLNAKVISDFPLLIPNRTVIEAFKTLIDPLRDKVVANVSESSSLAALRDTLLPKLISGEMRVPDAEKLVEAAV